MNCSCVCYEAFYSGDCFKQNQATTKMGICYQNGYLLPNRVLEINTLKYHGHL